MDKKLQESLQQLRRENRVRGWRPRRELREAIQQWVADGRDRGLTWRAISDELTIDQGKLKSWRQQAERTTSSSGSARLQMLPVAIAEPAAGKATVVIVRGVSMSEIAALLEGL
jgi:transposase-like protein